MANVAGKNNSSDNIDDSLAHVFAVWNDVNCCGASSPGECLDLAGMRKVRVYLSVRSNLERRSVRLVTYWFWNFLQHFGDRFNYDAIPKEGKWYTGGWESDAEARTRTKSILQWLKGLATPKEVE